MNIENYLALGSEDKGWFLSYYYQVKFIHECKAKDVLEIGVGNKTLINYLRQHNINAVSCDTVEKFRPDHIGDIRNLPFEGNSFDVVCAFQVLEHLPWNEVEKALQEMARVSRKHVIFSIPYTPVSIELALRSSLLYRLIRKWEARIFINLALITRPWKYDGVHYWEMGKKNYPRKKIRTLLRKHFRILKEKRTDFSYQYFFVLEKKQNA